MRSRGVAALLAVTGLSIAAIGCGGTDHAQDQQAAAPRATTSTRAATSTTATATTTTTSTTPASPPTTVAATTTVATSPPVTIATTPPTPAPPPPPPAPLLVTQLGGIGSAQQVIAVAASGYGSSTATATFTAYERDATGWKQTFGPWDAYVGRNGVAPIGAKREGDGRTPSGIYGFDFMFGVQSDPGVHFPYRRVTGTNIVWDDDSNSANYNRWIDVNTASAGTSPEAMYSTPSYNYGAVIAYNSARTPGLGSAIFLHVSHGSSTAGCVSLSTDQLLAVLRWLDPARQPRIAIGTLAALTGS